MFYPRFQNQIYKVDPARRQPSDPLPTQERADGVYAEAEGKLEERKVAAGRGQGEGEKDEDPPEIRDVPEWQEGGVGTRDAEGGAEQSKQGKERRKSVREKVKGVFGRKKDTEENVVR